MDAPGIMEVVEVLRRHIRIPRLNAGDENVRMSCPFAGWSHVHKSKVDTNPGCSVKVDHEGCSVFLCWTCGERGTLVAMLDRLWALSSIQEIRVLCEKIS